MNLKMKNIKPSLILNIKYIKAEGKFFPYRFDRAQDCLDLLFIGRKVGSLRIAQVDVSVIPEIRETFFFS